MVHSQGLPFGTVPCRPGAMSSPLGTAVEKGG